MTLAGGVNALIALSLGDFHHADWSRSGWLAIAYLVMPLGLNFLANFLGSDIEFLPDLNEGIRVAKAEGRPVLIWVSGDDPLERC